MAQPELRIELCRGASALADLEAPWRALLARCGAHPWFNSPDWLLSHQRAFGTPGERTAVLTVWKDTDLLGLLALVREPERQALILRRARLLGDGSFDSDHLEPLIEPKRRAAVAEALVRGLSRARLADYAILRTLPQKSPGVEAFVAALERAGRPLRREQRLAACTRLPGEFELYVASLRPRMRSKLRQALRRADERQWRHEQLEPERELAPWLAQLFELHQARWIAAGQPGAFADPRRVALYRSAFEHLHAAGLARMDRLIGPDGPVAIQAGFDADGAYHQLQEGYAPALSGDRPGIALRALALRAAIERRLSRYDFLGGFSDHKSDWGAEPVNLWSLTLPLAPWAGRFAVQALLRRAPQGDLAEQAAAGAEAAAPEAER
jgi:CelD/BcsL family acetyltransferase involved in cellulose biosynthesis